VRRAWLMSVVTVLALGVGCSDGSGGGGGGGGPDGGCTGASCAPPDGGGGPDGGSPDSGVGVLTASPDRIVIGTTPGAAKSAQLTLQNTGSSSVSLQSLNLTGAQASAFSVSGATVPTDVAAGASVTLTVSFNGTAGVSRASLAAVTPGGTTAVPLGGLAIAAGTEPSLQWIFDVHNIPVNAGNPDPTKRDFPPIPIAGDETGIQSFVKAGDGPVTLQLLASYGPDKEPVSINGWYPSGNGAGRTELFRIAQANAFALDPPIENGGTLSFDPGSATFGFWNEWPFWETSGNYVVYQEDSLNTWDTGAGGTHHHMRVYPYKNPDGSPVANAYIVTTEEAPISAGPDYNDIVYVVRNVKPPGSTGGGGALQLINQDGQPSSDRMMFSIITTIAPCWGPLTVKDSGTLTVKNQGSSNVTVSAMDVPAGFTATPSTALPVTLPAGGSFDVNVKFVATDGRVHSGNLTLHSDDPSSPTRTVVLAGFRQDIPQNSSFPTVSTEPDLDELVNGLYGYSTVVGTKQQLINGGGEIVAVGDEVLSPYWVKADSSQPVTMQLLSAFHSGWDCGDPRAVSYGSFAYWFPKGRTSKSDDHYILGGAKEDIQRLLPRRYENPMQQATGTLTPDPGTQQFGFHIELEFSDPSMAEQEPWCVTDGRPCGHRMRFWPVKDGSGGTVPNTWIVAVDMHLAASPGVAFFANYDFNDEVYLVRNMMPAPP
jgi:HYDIN/CFA65/VesB-like, Ig-like domain